MNDGDLADFRPPPWPGRSVLDGRYVRLEALDGARHAGVIHAAMSDDIWKYMPYGPFPAEGAYRHWCEDMAAKPDPVFYAIRPEGSSAAGVASFLRIVPAMGVIEIGHIALAASMQRTRAATEALSLMIGWAFRAGYRRVEWKCDAANAASRRAAERLGFTFEGVFRQAAIVKGRNRDTAWFAIIDGDWPALRDAHAAWLEPGNFDAQGRQRSSLSEVREGLSDRGD